MYCITTRIRVVPVTADRGLCGGFNSSINRDTSKFVKSLEEKGKKVQLITVGKKSRDFFNRIMKDKIVHSFADLGSTGVGYDVATACDFAAIGSLDCGLLCDSAAKRTWLVDRFLEADRVIQRIDEAPVVPPNMRKRFCLASFEANPRWTPMLEGIASAQREQGHRVRVYQIVSDSGEMTNNVSSPK